MALSIVQIVRQIEIYLIFRSAFFTEEALRNCIISGSSLRQLDHYTSRLKSYSAVKTVLFVSCNNVLDNDRVMHNTCPKAVLYVYHKQLYTFSNQLTVSVPKLSLSKAFDLVEPHTVLQNGKGLIHKAFFFLVNNLKS